jgi:N-acetyltransferase
VFDTLASPLTGSLVDLELLDERHVDGLRAAAADPRVSQWLPVPLDQPRWFDWWLGDARSVEIGWTWLAPTAWRTGANVEAKLLMLAQAFERADCVRVELKTDARNERSRAAMAALPAQFEGIHRQHKVRLDGTLRDSAWFSVLDREWPDVRANLERRLGAQTQA